MCKFIEQEAIEKANEIEDAANEVRTLFSKSIEIPFVQEFNLEKLQVLEIEKTNIRKEFTRKEAQAEVQKKMQGC